MELLYISLNKPHKHICFIWRQFLFSIVGLLLMPSFPIVIVAFRFQIIHCHFERKSIRSLTFGQRWASIIIQNGCSMRWVRRGLFSHSKIERSFFSKNFNNDGQRNNKRFFLQYSRSKGPLCNNNDHSA